MTQQAKLNKVVERLRPYKPEKIILYGSRARGDNREDSDIDLLIVKKTKKQYFDRMGDIQKLLYKKEYFLDPNEFIRGLDLIVYTPQEIEERKNLGDFFVNRIFKEGKLIYGTK
ncbi:nucleotidyltransferase domain-containing protein [Candidatus Parcubacteria bacterium]|nr:nucleotidyltransferase domain-containing protein [Candidatus Parcubacteria bacterium]